MRILVYQLFILCIVFASCNNEEFDFCEYPATVVDKTGFDGCNWVLELENGDLLEPIWEGTDYQNAKIKDVSLTNGLKVNISYRVKEDMVSICMSGKIVEVTCIIPVSALPD